jgi:hypothetical protein
MLHCGVDDGVRRLNMLSNGVFGTVSWLKSCEDEGLLMLSVC